MIVVKEDFRLQVGPALETFRAGLVVKDEQLARVLLAAHVPVEEVDEDDTLVQCPHCRRHFTVTHAVAAED